VFTDHKAIRQSKNILKHRPQLPLNCGEAGFSLVDQNSQHPQKPRRDASLSMSELVPEPELPPDEEIEVEKNGKRAKLGKFLYIITTNFMLFARYTNGSVDTKNGPKAKN
jgi:hypothetical protein